MQMEVPGTIQPLVTELLQHVGQAGEILVRVAPADLAYLREAGALPRLEGRRAQLAADESIVPGGCRVETERGSDIGVVVIAPHDLAAATLEGELKPIVRVATEHDLDVAESD